MRVTVPRVVWLLLLLPGCSQAPGAEDGEPPITTIDDPRNLTGSADGRPHVHDYWRGALEKTIVDDLVELDTEFSYCQLDDVVVESCRSIVPPEGNTVYPGAKWLNITLTWSHSPQAAAPTVRLSYSSPLDTMRATEEFESGETISLNLTQLETDVPHTIVSQWFFRLTTRSEVPATVSVHVTMTIARLPGPLPVASPHPDHWNGSQELVLHDSSAPLNDVAGIPVGSHSSPERTIPLSTIVPPNTESVRIRFTYNSSTPTLLHYNPTMRWHGADQPFYGSPVPPSSTTISNTNGEIVFEISPEAQHWDSPYANRTQWQITVAWHTEALAPFTFGPAAMQGDYRLQVMAFRSGH